MLEMLWPSVCAGCGVRERGIVCPACSPGRLHRAPASIPGIRGVFTTAGYASGTGKAMLVAKSGKRPLAMALAHAFGDALAPLAAGPFTAIVPAPVVTSRLVERGFSMPALLARELARTTRRPIVPALAIAPGVRQAALDLRARRDNLRGRVRTVRGVPACVLLVDDVVTTGATAEACARELLCAGADEVWLATVCAARVTGVRKS
jgi:predicted amidophosphoribosyltransferase